MNELLDQVSFIEPKGFLSFFGGSKKLTNEWIQLFYIGRTIFSQETQFPIKGQLTPILERKKIRPLYIPVYTGIYQMVI